MAQGLLPSQVPNPCRQALCQPKGFARLVRPEPRLRRAELFDFAPEGLPLLAAERHEGRADELGLGAPRCEQRNCRAFTALLDPDHVKDRLGERLGLEPALGAADTADPLLSALPRRAF